MNYETLIKHGLSLRDCYVLEMLALGDCSPSAIAGELISLASMTRITDKLIDKGMITRTPSREDRRRFILSITEAGKEAIR